MVIALRGSSSESSLGLVAAAASPRNLEAIIESALAWVHVARNQLLDPKSRTGLIPTAIISSQPLKCDPVRNVTARR